jgi:hypothetical protein
MQRRFIIIGIITGITDMLVIIIIATIDFAIRDAELHGDREMCPAALKIRTQFRRQPFANPGGYEDANVR